MGHIILGLIIIAVGLSFLVKTEFFLRVFGRIYFFERHFGSDGGSRLGYKFIGMIFLFIGILVLTNMFGKFALWVFSPLLRNSAVMQ